MTEFHLKEVFGGGGMGVLPKGKKRGKDAQAIDNAWENFGNFTDFNALRVTDPRSGGKGVDLVGLAWTGGMSPMPKVQSPKSKVGKPNLKGGRYSTHLCNLMPAWTGSDGGVAWAGAWGGISVSTWGRAVPIPRRGGFAWTGLDGMTDFHLKEVFGGGGMGVLPKGKKRGKDAQAIDNAWENFGNFTDFNALRVTDPRSGGKGVDLVGLAWTGGMSPMPKVQGPRSGNFRSGRSRARGCLRGVKDSADWLGFFIIF